VAETSGEYVERFGLSWRVALRIGLCVVFVVVALAVPMPIALRVCGVVLFGAGALVFARIATIREVALRVDASGVTLGGYPLRYAATTEHLPWADIEAIVLWRQQVRTATLRYVGVQRGPLAPPPRGSRLGDSISSNLVSHVPPELVRSSRLVVGWRLDQHRLVEAAARFSPGTPVQEWGW
jgi:hypothetical protein